MTVQHGATVPDGVAGQVVRNQDAAVVLQDAGGRIVGHNPAALRVLQMSAEQLAGRSSLDPSWEAVDTELRPLSGDEHPAMVALRTGRPVHDRVMGVRVGGGAYRWLRVDSWPLDGDERGVVTQFRDITPELEARSQMADALRRLQRHALPGVHPTSDWLTAESRYQAVAGPLEIGGDFLDVFSIDDQRLGFFIGDACGHDLDTVTTMVIARHTLRAAGLHFHRPGQVLRWLDDLLQSTADTVFCTAIYGTLTPTADRGIDVVFANAGHPAPILVSASGAVELGQHGQVVGAHGVPFSEPPMVQTHLEPGDRLVLYTNGLLESHRPRRSADELLGLLVGSHLGGPVDPLAVVDALIVATDAHPERRDDMAALVLTAAGAS